MFKPSLAILACTSSWVMYDRPSTSAACTLLRPARFVRRKPIWYTSLAPRG